MFRLTQGACPHHLPQTPPTTLSAHIATGGADLDFPPFSYVQFIFRFSENVAERHIPKCENIRSNKKR